MDVIDFHNFYKYALSLDDTDCMGFLLAEYLLIDFQSEPISRRIQDFVFLLLKNGLSENETLNLLVEVLYFIPRLDILYECNIPYEHLKEYKFGKFIRPERIMYFMLFNEFDEADFNASLNILLKWYYKYDTKPNDSLLKRLNMLLDSETVPHVMDYFNDFGNKQTKHLIGSFKTFQSSTGSNCSEQLWNKISRDVNEKMILALEKGSEVTHPNFAFTDGGKVRLTTYRSDDHYHVPEDDPVKSLCLIFDIHDYKNKPRKGSKVDTNLIRKTFEELHFTIQLYENVTKVEMFDIAKDYANVDLGNSGAVFVCFILAHGGKDCIFDINYETVNIRQFSLLFSAKNCKAYRNKPKLFFIQACQGDRFHEGIPESSPSYALPECESLDCKPKMVEYKKSDIIPEEADFIYGLATCPDYVAYRSTKHGTWYITELCKKISEDIKKTDIISILVSVHHNVSQKSYKNTCQMPVVYFTTRKKCFLTNQVDTAT